jgi:hypothetical protein
MGSLPAEPEAMTKRKGSLRLDGDAWFLRVYIAGRQRSFHLGHRRDFRQRGRGPRRSGYCMFHRLKRSLPLTGLPHHIFRTALVGLPWTARIPPCPISPRYLIS